MLKPTVRNLYQFMSVQAELHNPIVARYYSYNPRCKFLLVKSHGSYLKIIFDSDNSYDIRITKDCAIQAETRIPQYSKTKVYRWGIQVNN